MFLGDFQVAGGKIEQIKRVVDNAKYNIYECLVKIEDIETSAMIQEHISGMTLLGFKEKDVEIRIQEKVSKKCDTEAKKLISKRNRWLTICTIIRALSFCIMFYYGFSIVLMLGADATILTFLQSVLGVVLGIIIKLVGKNLQNIYVNLIPGQIKVLS